MRTVKQYEYRTKFNANVWGGFTNDIKQDFVEK